MRKICNIDGLAVYEQTGLLPGHEHWLEAALTPAQLQFMQNHRLVHRNHPRHAPTQELFVDDENLTEKDWTMIRLLF